MMKTKTIYRAPLGNPQRKYRQDRFIIGACKAWGVGEPHEVENIRGCIKACKELGCDQAEFIWATPEMTKECIDACEEFELDGIFQDWESFGGFQSSIGQADVNVPKFKEFMKNGDMYRYFQGYTVWDEPLSDESLVNASRQVTQVEELDPERIASTCAIPSYNASYTWENGLFEEYLRKYADIVNPVVMMLDYYPFSAMRPEAYEQLDCSSLFLDIALLRYLSLEKQTPMWFCIQTQDSPFGERYYRFTPARIKMQAYNVLLHGGKGILLYNTIEGAIYNDGRKGPLYFQIKELVEKIHQWGKTMMALTSVNVYHSPELLAGNASFDKFRVPLSESKVLADKDLPVRCSVGEFEDDEGNRYLVVLNRDYLNRKKFGLNLKKNFRVYQVSNEDGMQRIRNGNTRKINVELEPGEAIFLRFQDTRQEAFLIDYVLKK